jgi:hypothetical protein
LLHPRPDQIKAYFLYRAALQLGAASDQQKRKQERDQYDRYFYNLHNYLQVQQDYT